MRSLVLLQQRQRLGLISAQQGRGSGGLAEVAGGMIHQSRIDAFLSASHGLSASELMSASSLQDRERIITAELMKHRQEQLDHQEQVAAMAIASRNQAFSKQQHPEDLILKRAISRLSAISRHSMPQSHSQDTHQQALDNSNGRCSNPLYCTEQELSLEKDICFGRGQRVQRRKANVAFRKIVATYQETYDQAVSREDKKAVVKKVSRIFSRTGYRFFKESEDAGPVYGNGSKMWIAVSDHHVEYKIGHSFRSGRKQLKQQKKQRKEKEGSDVSVSSSEVLMNKSQSRPAVAQKSNNHSVYKEDELSDKCICIGDKREKYTGMEAYQYFREFILTFKSIFGMTDSLAEKTKIVTGLIEQIKSKKGYRFLKLMPTKKYVEFWVEASAEEISCEVFSIIGNPDEPTEKKVLSATNSNAEKKVNDDHDTQDKSSPIEGNEGLAFSMGRKKQKRFSDTSGSIDSVPPKKRRFVLPFTSSKENSSRPSAVKRTVSDVDQSLKDDKTGFIAPKIANKVVRGKTKGDLVSSSSTSSTTKLEEKGDSNSALTKGRKRALPEGLKNHNFIPSEILCKTGIAKTDCPADTSAKLKNGADPLFKVEREIISAISGQGVIIPPSLTSPSAFMGSFSFGNRSPGMPERGSQSLANMVSREKILQDNRIPSPDSLDRSTLEKALLAMRPSIQGTRDRSMVDHANLEAAKQMEMNGNLLQQLREQELLYMEKRHKLAMLDLQLRSRNEGV